MHAHIHIITNKRSMNHTIKNPRHCLQSPELRSAPDPLPSTGKLSGVRAASPTRLPAHLRSSCCSILCLPTVCLSNASCRQGSFWLKVELSPCLWGGHSLSCLTDGEAEGGMFTQVTYFKCETEAEVSSFPPTSKGFAPTQSTSPPHRRLSFMTLLNKPSEWGVGRPSPGNAQALSILRTQLCLSPGIPVPSLHSCHIPSPGTGNVSSDEL